MAGKKFSCYLDDELVADLDKIAKRLEISRNRVIRMACRLLVKQFSADEFDLQSYYDLISQRYTKR